MREKINISIIPDFGSDLELDFDDPVPENREQKLAEAGDGLARGAITVNEYRHIMGQDPTDNGDVFLRPFNLITVGEEEDVRALPESAKTPPEEPIKVISDPKVKSIFQTEQAKEAFWKGFAKRTESYEKPMIASLNKIFENTKTEALDGLEKATSRNDKLIDVDNFKADYIKAVTPVLTHAVLDSLMNGMALIKPTTPHKDIPNIISEAALAWLKTRIGWAANELGAETEKVLRQILLDGYEQGLGIDEIARNIRETFAFSKVRAERIARTEIITGANQGALEGYKEAGVTDMEFYTAGEDGRTCELCLSFDTKIFSYEDAQNFITGSTHPSCRCTWLPVIEL